MTLDEDLLLDLAGYPAVKAARLLHAAGGVLAFSVSDGAGDSTVVKGQVQEGRRKFACGLVIRSATDADCHCSCPTARRDGQVCAHALAAAIAAIHTQDEAATGDEPDVARGGELAPSTPTVAEIPTRIPLSIERDADALEEFAWLTRPMLPEHRFAREDSGNISLVAANKLTIPTRFLDCPPPFQQEIRPLLRDSGCPERLRVTHNWLRINADHLHCMFHVECSDGLIESLRLLPGAPEVRIEVEGSLRRIDVSVRFQYPENTVPHPHREAEILSRLAPVEFGTPYEGKNEGERMAVGALRGESLILAFYAGPLDRAIADNEWQVQLGERFANLTSEVDRVKPRFTSHQGSQSGTDWFGFDLTFDLENERVSIPESEVRRLVATGQSVIKLPNGKRAALDSKSAGELFESLESLESSKSGSAGARVVEGAQQFYAEEIIKDFTDPDPLRVGSEPDLSETRIELRPYQREGVKWVKRRLDADLGAVLADEMGLGKTVQALALIADRFAMGATEPALIVAPTSLLATWQAEAKRFVPHLPVQLLHGAGREKAIASLEGRCIGVTSFGTLARDFEGTLGEVSFSLVVADEASLIRNPSTKASRAVRSLQARSRLALTGTPLENSLKDLWAIFEFAIPGYLGGSAEFLARYQEEGQFNQLRRRVAPYILRRLKSDVATDLPSKTEKIVYCELTDQQRKSYQYFLQEKRNILSKSPASSAQRGANSLELLTLLMRLRQICCDVRLLPKGAVKLLKNKQEELVSCKLRTLETLLERAHSSGHRVLIFSQFVGMLALVQELLAELGMDYCYLDGASSRQQRADEVARFQSGEGAPPVFLISLKAGGYGLTLTAADTVIHLDPWWNPAVEAQATDRAHRIGQTRPVTSYKLITTGTVEEKILALQQKKRQVVGAALDDVQPMMAELSAEELTELLS